MLTVKQTKKEAETSQTPATSSGANSLFGDDDDGDLFGATTNPTSKQSTAPPSHVKPKASLFANNDDDDDDLFSSVGVTSKKQSTVSTTKRDGKSEVKTDQTYNNSGTNVKDQTSSRLILVDDESDLFSSTSKSDSKQIPLPAASQPSTNKVPSKSLSQTSQPMKQEASKDRQKKVLSLFDDNDDDDDLFGSSLKETKPSKSTEVPEVATQQSKKSKKTPMLFADEDLLFSNQDDTPDVDLFGSVSPKESPSKLPRRVSREETSNPPATASIKKDTTDVPKKSVNPDVKQTVSEKSRNIGQLFDNSDDDNEDLFSEAKPKTTKKLPAGAVSIFGGRQDVMKEAFARTRQPSSGDSSSRDSVSPDKTNDMINSNTGRDSASPEASKAVTNKAKLTPPPVMEKSAVKTIVDDETEYKGRSSAKSASIAQLQAKMKINPTLHVLGGTTKPVVEPVAVGFDQHPVQTNILSSISKDRAKIQSKRRPPSRRSIQPGANTSTVKTANVTSASTNHSHSLSSTADHTQVQDDLTGLHSTQVSSNLSDEPDSSITTPAETVNTVVDTEGSTVTTSIASTRVKASKLSAFASPSEINDLFSTESNVSSQIGVPNKYNSAPVSNPGVDERLQIDIPVDEDLFSVKSVTTRDISSKTSEPSKPVALPVEDNIDLFSVSVPPAQSRHHIVSAAQSSEVALSNKSIVSSKDSTEKQFVIDDNDDDLFGISVPKTKLPTNKSAVSSKTIVPDNESDNLFSSSQSSKNVVSNSEATVAQSNDMDIPPVATSFNTTSLVSTKPTKTVLVDYDDDSDLFGAPVKPIVQPATRSIGAKVKSKVSDVNDDDIFSDSSLKKAASKPSTKIAFDDDDDIFADSSLFKKAPSTKTTSNAATKKSALSSVRKKASTKDENLFADDTDIFADLSLSSNRKDVKPSSNKRSTAAVLDDSDNDDIFGEPVIKTKSATDNQPKTKVPLPQKIDDESEDIFADPLNAMLK